MTSAAAGRGEVRGLRGAFFGFLRESGLRVGDELSALLGNQMERRGRRGAAGSGSRNKSGDTLNGEENE